MMKEAWSSMGEDTEEELGVTVPDGLKKYTIEDRKIILQKSMRQKPETPGISYDGPEVQSKSIWPTKEKSSEWFG